MLSVSVKFSNVKKSARQLLMLMIVSFSALTTFAQPANDEPCNAIDLTPGATCSYATYTNAAATASSGVPAPGGNVKKRPHGRMGVRSARSRGTAT